MKVRTVKEHFNAHPPVPVKAHGRVYELPDTEARRLIARGYVEAANDGNVADTRPKGAGAGSGGAKKRDSAKRSPTNAEGSGGASSEGGEGASAS